MTRARALWLAGLLVTLAVAAVVSSFASGAPDGLERVAADEGFSSAAREHDLAGSPLADYAVDGVDEGVSVGVAGVAGVATTLAVAGGVLWVLRRPRVDD